MLQENIQSVLASEQRVSSLMGHLDVAIAEVERVEKQLNAYDETICHVRDTMEKMEEKNRLIEVANKNNQKLLTELEKVIVRVSIDLLEIAVTTSFFVISFFFFFSVRAGIG